MFENLKKMVWTDDAPEAEKKVAQPVQAQSMMPAVSVSTEQATTLLDVAQIESDLTGIILATPAMAEYVKFNGAHESLKAVIPDESTRFKAAAATSQTTSQSISTALLSVADVLAAEQNNFQVQFLNVQVQSVAEQKQAIDRLTAEIAEKTAQLEAMKTELSEKSQQVIVSEANIAKAQIDFGTVVQRITQHFAEIGKKVQIYIGA